MEGYEIDLDNMEDAEVEEIEQRRIAFVEE